MKKEDRRVTMTRRMLKEALTGMLKTSDMYHITIRELCARADVNRTTFYKYYGSQFDLLSDMEQDLLDYLARAVADNGGDVERIIETACAYCEENLEFVRLIVGNNVDPDFPEKLFSLDAIQAAARKRCEAFETRREAEYFYHYMTYGAYRIVCTWLGKDDRESPAELAKILSRILQF